MLTARLDCLFGGVALGFLSQLVWTTVQFQHGDRLHLGQYLDALQFAIHRSTPATDFDIDDVLRLLELTAYLVQNAGEFPKFGATLAGERRPGRDDGRPRRRGPRSAGTARRSRSSAATECTSQRSFSPNCE
jgi:hypothetical protein